jgi:hypothetical protein
MWLVYEPKGSKHPKNAQIRDIDAKDPARARLYSAQWIGKGNAAETKAYRVCNDESEGLVG